MLERLIEQDLVHKLVDLKYTYRDDICDQATLEANFRQKFETLNQAHLTDAEFTRLKEDIITRDVFVAAKTLRGKNTFILDDCTPVHYTLVNTKDWCKNTFEVISQLGINTEYSHHRYDVIILINGVPVTQSAPQNFRRRTTHRLTCTPPIGLESPHPKRTRTDARSHSPITQAHARPRDLGVKSL